MPFFGRGGPFFFLVCLMVGEDRTCPLPLPSPKRIDILSRPTRNRLSASLRPSVSPSFSLSSTCMEVASPPFFDSYRQSSRIVRGLPFAFFRSFIGAVASVIFRPKSHGVIFFLFFSRFRCLKEGGLHLFLSQVKRCRKSSSFFFRLVLYGGWSLVIFSPLLDLQPAQRLPFFLSLSSFSRPALAPPERLFFKCDGSFLFPSPLLLPSPKQGATIAAVVFLPPHLPT